MPVFYLLIKSYICKDDPFRKTYWLPKASLPHLSELYVYI